MRLLGLWSINEVGTLVRESSGIVGRVLGVSVHIQANDADAVIIRSGASGFEATEFQGRPIAQGGQAYSFGGPVGGPLVSVDWQGTADLKRGVVLLWDEPIAAFGRVLLDQFTEAGIGAGASSADWTPNAFGPWVRRVQWLWTGNRAFQLDLRPSVGSVYPTLKGAMGSASADGWAAVEVDHMADVYEASFLNPGAAGGEVFASVMGYMV